VADISDLLDHAAAVRPPGLERLEAVATRRRRRATLAVAGGVAAAVVATLLALQPLAPRDAAPAPIAPSPTPSEPRRPDPTTSTPPPDSIQGPFPALTPAEVRNHPDAVAERQDDIPVTAAPGVAARLWTVCLADCSRATTHQVGEMQRALEVTRDDYRSSALYPYAPPEPNVSHVVDDTFLVGDQLVDGGGERRSVATGEPLPVTEIDGPLVYASSGVAWLDLDALRLHAIAGGGYWDWGGAGDTWHWGNVYVTDEAGDVVRQGLTWRNDDGSYGVRMLPVGVTDWSTQMLRSGVPGTMGAIEPGPVRLLHVSTDYGATWEVRVLPERWGTDTYVPDDWRSWTEDWPSWATP
jgi:hypothetical protein